MRTMIISALLLTAAATGAQAQSSGRGSDPGRSIREVGPSYGGALNNTLEATTLNRQAVRVVQARRAAELINAGKCDKALSYTAARNDDYLTQRVGEVCAAPRS